MGLLILLNKRLFIEGTERNFGTVEAPAFAFILGFLPREAVLIRKSEDNSDRKSNIFRSDCSK
ncbi:hypothetical protein D3C76_207050 [compost metagenome]